MARVYHRDSNGRFASGGGGGSGGGKRPKTAAGRASANLRLANKVIDKDPLNKKARFKRLAAEAALDQYKTMGGGRKGAAKPGAAKAKGKSAAKRKGPVTPVGRAGANLRAAEKALKKNPMDKKARFKRLAAQEALSTYKVFTENARKGAAKPGPKPGSRRKR